MMMMMMMMMMMEQYEDPGLFALTRSDLDCFDYQHGIIAN